VYVLSGFRPDFLASPMSNSSIEPTPTPSTPSATLSSTAIEPEKVLCPYCKRTASNGIKCKGACVADAS
jgi:hypothetical protein